MMIGGLSFDVVELYLIYLMANLCHGLRTLEGQRAKSNTSVQVPSFVVYCDSQCDLCSSSQKVYLHAVCRFITCVVCCFRLGIGIGTEWHDSEM